MKELVVLSGKGGTGKTSLVAAFASLSENMVLGDSDVDAADLHLIMAPKVGYRSDFRSGHTANIDKNKCTECGLCRDLCRWEAIGEDYTINSIDCEGCGVCVYFCPEDAIDFPLNTCGEWFISETRFGPMVHARLGIAEENSGKLVTLVRREARKLGEKKGLLEKRLGLSRRFRHRFQQAYWRRSSFARIDRRIQKIRWKVIARRVADRAHDPKLFVQRRQGQLNRVRFHIAGEGAGNAKQTLLLR